MYKKWLRVAAVCAAFLSCRYGLAQQIASSCPGPASGAFTGCYYSNQTLSGSPAFVRTDSQINFDWGSLWGTGSPDSSLAPGNFSVQWQGQFAFVSGTYKFRLVVSDGARLYIDNNLVIDNWIDEPPVVCAATEYLTSGNHLVVLQYYDKSPSATAQLSWAASSPAPQAPAITSFTAQPSSAAPNQAVTLSWAASNATSLTLSGIGDVTNQSSYTVYPSQTTSYTLTASNPAGSASANVTVNVSAGSDNQPPTAPGLISAVAKSATEVDLLWSASYDNVAVTGYQVLRNGVAIGSVPAQSLIFIDNSAAANSTYSYSVKAYDAAGNFSLPSNAMQVTTPALPAPPPSGTCPGPATNAFTGCYYNNTTLSGSPALIRTDSQINFDWGNASPGSPLAARNFSARWLGQFSFNQGTYSFRLITSDGMRLYIDGAIVLDAWVDQPPMLYSISRNITQGAHVLEIDYFEETGGATAQVSWSATTPPPPTQPPTISSFTATPSNASAGQTVTLAWAVSGASSISIDNGIGDVSSKTSVAVQPSATTTYTLTAANSAGATSSAAVTVNVGAPAGSPGAPTTPTLVSAIAKSANEVDLTWSASSSNSGIAYYQIYRDGWPLGTAPGSALTYSDSTVITSSVYSYTVKAYDPSGNYSAPSNAIQVTTPLAPGTSVTWYGPCWFNGTIYGITGNFQGIDFSLVTPAPVPVQGTLFDGADCTASGGDNMNDLNTLTGTTHMIQGFTHNPNAMPTSAIYWIGAPTGDGRCPPGSKLCSGCVNYNSATLSCSVMP